MSGISKDENNALKDFLYSEAIKYIPTKQSGRYNAYSRHSYPIVELLYSPPQATYAKYIIGLDVNNGTIWSEGPGWSKKEISLANPNCVLIASARAIDMVYCDWKIHRKGIVIPSKIVQVREKLKDYI